MANNLVFTTEEINTLSPNGNDISKVMHAVSVLGSDGEDLTTEDITEAKATIVAHRDELSDIWKKYKLIEKLLKNFKTATETAIMRFTDDDFNIAGLDRQFKWRKGATSRTCNDVGALLDIAFGNGLTTAEVGKFLKGVNAKDAAKMLGMSDDAFLNQFGNIVETKQNFPTLVGI